jgi:toxin ParE1/3/4
MKVRYTAAALAEISEILAYIAQDSPAAAQRMVRRIRDTVERLRTFPESAARTDDPSIRVAAVPRSPYLIFSMVEEDTLVVRNVRHAARQRP